MRINRRHLYVSLGLKGDKIPKDLEGTYYSVIIRDFAGTMITIADVIIYRATGAYAKHRIYVRCPICSRKIPFGRLAQHIGTKTCLNSLKPDLSKNVRLSMPQDLGTLADDILGK